MISAELESRLAPLSHQMRAVVDYRDFTVLPHALDEYSDMVRDVAGRCYSSVTRYTTIAFLRAKLGEALQRRDLAPHISERADDARDHLDRLTARAPRRALVHRRLSRIQTTALRQSTSPSEQPQWVVDASS